MQRLCGQLFLQRLLVYDRLFNFFLLRFAYKTFHPHCQVELSVVFGAISDDVSHIAVQFGVLNVLKI